MGLFGLDFGQVWGPKGRTRPKNDPDNAQTTSQSTTGNPNLRPHGLQQHPWTSENKCLQVNKSITRWASTNPAATQPSLEVCYRPPPRGKLIKTLLNPSKTLSKPSARQPQGKVHRQLPPVITQIAYRFQRESAMPQSSIGFEWDFNAILIRFS